MLSSEGSEILRVAILSGVIGFAGFCVSYGFYVWRKRNSTNRKSKSRARTLAHVCAFLGCATIALSWALNEFRGRIGIAGGSDVFVINARRETFAQQITLAGTVTQGEVVAEFLSPADRSRLAAIDLQIPKRRRRRKLSRTRPSNPMKLSSRSWPICDPSSCRTKLLSFSCGTHVTRSSVSERH